MRRLKSIRTWLAQPGWQGWNTIVAVVTLMATIAVATILFRFAQQEERQQIEATKADFDIGVFLIRDEMSGQWWIDLDLVNRGPATSLALRIDLRTGSTGVGPREPESTHGSVDTQFSIITDADRAGACYLASYTIRVFDALLPGDAISITQAFTVEEQRDLELSSSDALVSGTLATSGVIREGLIARWPSGESGQVLLGNFLRRLSIRGSNASYSQSWPNDSQC